MMLKMTLKCLCCPLHAIWCALVCVFLFSCVYLVPPFPCFKIFSSQALHLRKLKLSVISSLQYPPPRPDAVKSPQWAQPASKHLQAVLPSRYDCSLLSEMCASAERQVSSCMWNRTPKAWESFKTTSYGCMKASRGPHTHTTLKNVGLTNVSHGFCPASF